MHRIVWALALVPLAGCDLFQQGVDIVDGLTNPLVAQGIVLATSPPGTSEIDLAQAGLEEGTTATLFLADATSVNDLESAPVAGATVTIDGVEAAESAGGLYTLAPGALDYDPGGTWTVRAVIGGDTSSARLPLPQEADAGVPQTHTASTELVLDVSGQGFDSVLVIVFEATSGDITYSNEPQGIREFYDFTRGTEEAETVAIPAEAFPGDGVYAVGVAGLQHTVPGDLTEMNTALTTLMAGKMVWSPVTIGTLPN